MSNAITEVHEIKVYNESTRLFLVKSFYCYEIYISNMKEYMGDRFFKMIEDRVYMDDVFDKVIEKIRKDSISFLRSVKVLALSEMFYSMKSK